MLLFCVCLTALAFLVGLHGLFSSPQPLKTALQESGTYEEITQNVLAQQTATPTLPLKDIGIRTALTQSLPATFYQYSSEEIIDSTYDWTRGRTSAPQFSIDITPVKNKFANNVSSSVRERLDTLPRCDRTLAPPTSVDEALALICIPPPLTPAIIADTARQQVLASKLLFEDDTITAATLKDGQGRTFTQQLAFLPWLYRSYVPALVILPIVIALLGLAVVFGSAIRRTGLSRVAWMLLSIGLVGMTLATVGMELFHLSARVFGLPLSVTPDLQDKLLNAIETLAAGARPWWLSMDAGYTLLGIALFIILRMHRPSSSLRFSNK